MKKNNRNNKNFIVIFFLVFVLSISIGYSYLNETLTSNTKIKLTNSWDVSIKNIEYFMGNTENENLVQITESTKINISTQIIDSTQNLSFTIEIENSGEVDAMLKAYEVKGLNSFQTENYEISIKYDDDSLINNGDVLLKQSTKKIKITINIKDGIIIEDTNLEDTNLDLEISFDYDKNS